MNSMTPTQARRQAYWLNVLSWLIGAVSFLLLATSLLKGVYAWGAAPDASPLAAPFGRLAASVYGLLEGMAPPLMALLWQLAPDLNLRGRLISADHSGIFVLYCLMLLSLLPRGRASRLLRAVAEHESRVQQIIWEEQVRGLIGAGLSAAQVQQGLDVRISIESQRTPWHQRLFGVIVLGLTLPLVVDVIKILVGLAKLP